MTNAERSRAKNAARKARGACIDCDAPAAPFLRCPDCRERGKVYRARYNRKHPENARARAARHYALCAEKINQVNRERRLAKKLRGECEKCPLPVAKDSAYCAKHHDLELARKRDYNKRRRNGGPLKKGGVKPGTLRATVPLCDCGSSRSADKDACDRCLHLEGKGSSAFVVDALRGSDGMSLRELCEAVGINADLNNGTRQMWRWVKDLLATGRIRRYWREDSTTDVETMDSYRNGKGERTSAIGCWAYCLNGLTQEEWQTAYVVRTLAMVLVFRAKNEERRRAA